jgi:hypothetical protein
MTRTLGLRQVVTSSGVAIMASLCCIGELEQVVDGADHRPLGSDLVEATEEELVEASCIPAPRRHPRGAGCQSRGSLKNLALLRKQIVEPVFGQIKQLVREAGVEAQRHEAVEAQN